MYINIHTYIFTFAHLCMNVRMGVSLHKKDIYIYIYIYINTHIYIYIYEYKHMCIFVYV